MKPIYSLFTLWPWTLSPGQELALALLTAHLAGDFLLQTDAMAAKKRRPAVLCFHAAIQGGLAYLLAGQWALWGLPLAILLIHGLIDFLKAAFAREKARWFLLDQAAHLVSILLLAGIYGRSPLGAGWWSQAFGPPAWRFMVVAAGAILCVRTTSILMGFWVQPYLDELKQAHAQAPKAPVGRGLTNGGRVIGQWERALIFLFVLIGQPGAIGFLVAAKSIFRFGELMDRSNRMEAEYITIGTLMSFGMAVACSAGTLYLVHRLR